MSPHTKWHFLRSYVWLRSSLSHFLSITIGTIFYAIGIMKFTIPLHLPEAGLTGLAVLSHYVFHISPAWVIGLGNFFLLFWSWKHFSPRFAVLTLYAVILLTISLKLIPALPHPLVDDIFLMSVLGGVLKGIGLGLIFRSDASQGGIDIVVIALRRRFGIEVGAYSFYLNLIVISGSSLLLGLPAFVYGSVSLYTSALVLDKVLAAHEGRKQILVITEKTGDTVEFIIQTLRQGVTILSGRGGYSGRESQIVLSLLTIRQVVTLKRFLAEIDDRAFLVVSDANEVIGAGFKRWKNL